MKLSFDKGIRRKANPEYTRLCRIGDMKTIHSKNISLGLANDPNFKRLNYIRYADDFLISVIGSKKDAEMILSQVNDFLISELKLNVNSSKSKITHARVEKAHFLGHDIRITPNDKKPLIVNKEGKLIKVNTRIQLLAPIRLIIRKLIDRQIVNTNSRPTR